MTCDYRKRNDKERMNPFLYSDVFCAKSITWCMADVVRTLQLLLFVLTNTVFLLYLPSISARASRTLRYKSRDANFTYYR